MGEFLKVKMDLEKNISCPGGWKTKDITEFVPEDGHGHYRSRTYTTCDGEKKYEYKIIKTKIIKDGPEIDKKTTYKFNMADKFNFTKNNIQVKTISDKGVQSRSIDYLLDNLLNYYKIVFNKTGLLNRDSISIDNIRHTMSTNNKKNFNKDVIEDYIYTSIILTIPITKIQNKDTQFEETRAAEANTKAEEAEARAEKAETRAEEAEKQLTDCIDEMHITKLGGRKRKSKKQRKTKRKKSTKRIRRPTKKRKKKNKNKKIKKNKKIA